jgi:hypothetical protein
MLPNLLGLPGPLMPRRPKPWRGLRPVSRGETDVGTMRMQAIGRLAGKCIQSGDHRELRHGISRRRLKGRARRARDVARAPQEDHPFGSDHNFLVLNQQYLDRTEGKPGRAGLYPRQIRADDARRPGDGDAAGHAAVAVWRSPGGKGRGVSRGRADPAVHGAGTASMKTGPRYGAG